MSAVTAGSANLKPNEGPAFSGGSSWYVCVLVRVALCWDSPSHSM